MTTALLSHPDATTHETPAGHPEQIARMQAIRAALAGPEFAALLRLDAPLGHDGQLLLCHPESYITRIKQAIPAAGIYQLDADTHVCRRIHGCGIARGAGAASCAVDAILAGEAAKNAFVAMRPPGHHAETSTPMGFCLLGTSPLRAMRGLASRPARVAVVDFDVHHGNGTQDLLWDEPRAFFISSHQMPLWPGTGSPQRARRA
jgi:acetoin utilization deacetylase AcuC-like enzyme